MDKININTLAIFGYSKKILITICNPFINGLKTIIVPINGLKVT
jgi:hypothetical protein